eukprot:CAMPEP_0196598396 /NCGR_PEP_ID=MMETSP1081-20130531/94297_1 /TAXON_ID=36882 /ORGANISM="Pyramimonas amylifera, Strain CCMP720" /LENGTH=768 /DNA_ID=CAMNT_0041924087 /DNA_START=182 /DNA_END=2488 /DNA_ORIENTATION=+
MVEVAGLDFDEEIGCLDLPLKQVWAWEFMLLGFTVSAFGAFIGLSTTMIALTVLEHPKFKSWFFFFIFSSGVSIGFTCIWTMHFVGMQALTLSTCNGSDLIIYFNVLLTVASLLAVILISSLCIYLALPVGDQLKEPKYIPSETNTRKKTKRARSESFNQRYAEKKRKEAGPKFWVLPIKYQGKPVQVIKIDIVRFTAATMTMMLGVCVMHYMGMLAQDGPYTMKFDGLRVFESVLIAFVASGAGLFIVVQIAYQEKTSSLGLRLLASFIIGLAVNSMHYVGMTAATYTYTGDMSKSLMYTLGPTMNVPPAWICLVAMVSGVIMLLLSQHYSDLLYILQQKINDSLEKKLPKDIKEKLQEIYDEVKEQDNGEVATYIPQLGVADPSLFAICICDLGGELHTVGDVKTEFSIQSCCKPMLYMLAIEECGGMFVASKIGQEPSGQPFDALSIDPANRAYNPYVNAGAMMSASIIQNNIGSHEDVFEIFQGACEDCSMEDASLALDVGVYDSEMSCNTNNKNIAKELSKRGILEGSLNAAVESYTRCCSMLTTTENMAVMAATFANKGKNPMTLYQAIPKHAVDDMVTVMMSCGMYNGAGKWIVEVGLPAKSGVSGVVMCVVPGVCGIAVYSPRLDENGNSTRGVLVAKACSEKLGLHVLKNGEKEEGAGSVSMSMSTRKNRDTSVHSRKSSGDQGPRNTGKSRRSSQDSEEDLILQDFMNMDAPMPHAVPRSPKDTGGNFEKSFKKGDQTEMSHHANKNEGDVNVVEMDA